MSELLIEYISTMNNIYLYVPLYYLIKKSIIKCNKMHVSITHTENSIIWIIF